MRALAEDKTSAANTFKINISVKEKNSLNVISTIKC